MADGEDIESGAAAQPRPGAAPPAAPDEMVRGTVLAVESDLVRVEVAGRGSGVLPRAECADGLPAAGDSIDLVVLADTPRLLLSAAAVGRARVRAALAEAVAARRTVEGRIGGLVKGGYEVDLGGLLAFCPTAHIDLERGDDAAAYIGRVVPFAVLEVGREGRRTVVSRRRPLAAEARRRLREMRAQIVPGAVLEGRVTAVAPFGAFVDLGGAQGLLHVSEISHLRVERPEDALAPGQVVTVQVRRVDRASGRISLSRKALERDPWSEAATRLRPWLVVDGRLRRVEEVGAFVELLPGVEGLLHVEELPRRALEPLREAARARAAVAVVVLEVDARRHRVALALAPAGLAAGDVVVPVAARPGGIVHGRVEAITPAGVVVRLGPGQGGFVPRRETGVEHGDDIARVMPVGSEVTAEVVGSEFGGRRLRLSVARAIRREERAEVARHAAREGAVRLSTLGDLLQKALDRKG